MAFLFNRARPRQPAEVAHSIKDLLARLWESPNNGSKVEEDLAKQLAHMKLIVQGTQEVDTLPDQVQQLVHAVIQDDLLYELARSIRYLPFEARKDTQTIFSHILRFKPNPNSVDPPVISYIVHNRPEIIVELCWGYENHRSAMPCGSILREALKFEVITAIILYDESEKDEPAIRINEVVPGAQQTGEGLFWNFFQWINRGSFEVSADAFTTFREILTKHKGLVSQYLAANFEVFFSNYNNILVQSDSYVTKRQSIKLLGEILLDRANYNVMTKYVDRGDHLKLCMNLLRDDRKMVQYEGFHIFKVFVANPNKSVAVQRILINNRDRLLKFLPKFLEDRTDDDQFTDEKSFLVRQIEILPPEPIEPGRSMNGSGTATAA
ncbi:conidiophore development protein hymA [Helicocarpus griseus UAMH5409]|uniref:Conidiophore development protein hymA n=1 Tax=Helicocarpus griseus UAMH5409 TaxID=1447875 RepID=A0A2B7WYX4_9EURO|nr:conidiophore development protein hymA [Helicocarpus griseus UAMH5409]